MTDMSMRERLARALCRLDCPTPDVCADGWCGIAESDEPTWPTHKFHVECIDAILLELQEPSEGMIGRSIPAGNLHPDLATSGHLVRAIWEAMIQHIREGGS